MNWPLIFFSFFLVLDSFAAEGQEEVFFFGGMGAGTAEVNCWIRSAQTQAGEKYHFHAGIPYPAGASSAKASAIDKADQTINQLAAFIDSNQQKNYLLIGHSSGTAISDALASRVKRNRNLRVVNLDGWVPSSSNLEKTLCVYAIGMNGKSSAGTESMNQCKHKYQIPASQTEGCTNQWCLHFRTMNARSPSSVNGANMLTEGYKNCNANLIWLRN